MVVLTTQKALSCTERWVDSAGKTPTGASYTTSRCAPSDAQIYVSNGKVFALGLKLEAGLVEEGRVVVEVGESTRRDPRDHDLSLIHI